MNAQDTDHAWIWTCRPAINNVIGMRWDISQQGHFYRIYNGVDNLYHAFQDGERVGHGYLGLHNAMESCSRTIGIETRHIWELSP